MAPINYNDGNNGWRLSPVGRTALEQSLSRELSHSLSIFAVQMNTPEPFSHSSALGLDHGFAPRRVRIKTRLGREGERDLDLFFKIPWEREIESYILGRRLGLRHQPKLITTAVEILSPVGEPQQAMTYFYHPGENLAEADLTSVDWRLPDELIDDVARLHASTASAAPSYVGRGYPEHGPEEYQNRLQSLNIDDIFILPTLNERRVEIEPLLGRALSAAFGAVESAFACGMTVTHGDLNAYNVIIGAQKPAEDRDDGKGRNLIIDWGDFGVTTPTVDLAPCLAYDQLERYTTVVRGENPNWPPPDLTALASMKLIQGVENLTRIARGWREQAAWLFDHEAEPAFLDNWLARISQALEHLE